MTKTFKFQKIVTVLFLFLILFSLPNLALMEKDVLCKQH